MIHLKLALGIFGVGYFVAALYRGRRYHSATIRLRLRLVGK